VSSLSLVSNQERAIITFDTTYREEERKKLQHLNGRLKVVLEREQSETSHLKNRLVDLKEKEVFIQEEKERLSHHVGDVVDDLLYKNNKLATADIEKAKVLHILNEKQQQHSTLNIEDDHLQSLLSILEQKKEEYKKLETNVSQYQSKLKETVGERDRILNRRGQLMEELLEFKKKTNQKDSDYEHLQLQLRIHQMEKARLKEKHDAYTGKDPKTYYKWQYEMKLQATVKDLEAKYSEIKRNRSKTIEEECQKKLDKHIQEDHAEKDEGNQIGKECAALREQFSSSNQKLKNMQEDHVKLQDEISRKEGLIMEKAQEIQAAVVLNKTTSQEKISLGKRIQELKEITNKLSVTQKHLIRDIEDSKKRTAKQLEDLDEEIDGHRQRIAFLRGQLNQANVDMDPEISKYKGLVEIAEYNFVSERPQKRVRIAE